jgi:prepilin-type N-terminal cleavage/methylation domain-containing protein
MKISVSKYNKGFTLIELLVVIAIIGIISTATVTNLNRAKAKARDARRLSDITQITKALEVYYYTEGAYPNINCHNAASPAECNSINPGTTDRNWISDLGIDLPIDPINISAESYFYTFIRDMNESTDYENYYYLLYNLETEPISDRCNGNPFVSFSCVGGGNLP